MDIQEISLAGPVNVPAGTVRGERGVTRPLHTALALSGGGAKGSFEVGAPQFLYSTGFFAKTICGTSVGSVNALQLAHGGTPAAQADAASALLGFWNAISWANPFYVQDNLLKQALNAMREWTRLFDPIDLVVWPIGAAKLASVVGASVPLVEPALRARALFDMSPLRRMIVAALRPAVLRSSGVSLRLCVVSLESGEVRYVDEAGRLLDRTLVPGVAPLGVAPECEAKLRAYRAALAAKGNISQSSYVGERGAFDRSGYLEDVAEARRAVGEAEAALTACELAHPRVPQVVSLVDATMASSAIPVLFRPVSLVGENYVDGGVMLQLPLEAAIRADPDVIVAINTGKFALDRKEGFASANILPIAERSLELAMWEAMARQIELAQRSGKPIFMIAPRLDVHGTLDQDPGLLSINIDYGFMCAADIAGDVDWTMTVPSGTRPIDMLLVPAAAPIVGRTGPVDPQLAALADAITRARLQCWAIEFEVHGEWMTTEPFGGPPRGVRRVGSPEALDRLRELKTLIAILAATRSQMGGRMPPTATTWSTAYERHEFSTVGSPWDAFGSGAGTRPSATPGTALVVVDENGSNFLLNPPGRFPITNLGAVLLGGVPAAISSELYEAIPLGPSI